MMTTRRKFGLLAASFIVAGSGFLSTSSLKAAPSAELWDVWTKNDPQSQAVIDHSSYQNFLDSYLLVREEEVNLLDYAAVTPADRERLAGYLDSLTSLPISTYNRDQQMAYWINLYNALTIKVVLDHYPVESIKDIDISPGLFSQGPWGKKLVMVEDRELSLDDIEHRILRPIWKDPRIHYAVNCAAWSCPELHATAFNPTILDSQLDKAAKAYANDPRGVLLEDGELVLSSIYDWYGEDFGKNEEEIIAHIANYAEPRLRNELSGIRSVSNYRYDWALNAPDVGKSSKEASSGREPKGSHRR